MPFINSLHQLNTYFNLIFCNYGAHWDKNHSYLCIYIYIQVAKHAKKVTIWPRSTFIFLMEKRFGFEQEMPLEVDEWALESTFRKKPSELRYRFVQLTCFSCAPFSHFIPIHRLTWETPLIQSIYHTPPTEFRLRGFCEVTVYFVTILFHFPSLNIMNSSRSNLKCNNRVFYLNFFLKKEWKCPSCFRRSPSWVVCSTWFRSK